MHFQDRVRQITGLLNDFLRLYKRPDHLDNETALIELREVAEEVNLLIPTSFSQDDLAARVNDALRMMRQTYKGRSWPTVSHFVDAINAVSKRSVKAVDHADAKEPQKLDTLDVMARRMNEGEAVGDDWIYGRNALRLEQSGKVGRDVIRKYRSALYFAAKEAVGEDLAKSMEKNWLQRHEDAEVLQ